jgi:hypothetical protein
MERDDTTPHRIATDGMVNWQEANASLNSLADRQIFFVGGAPRSGTTWLQQLLNAHPDVSCAGEGLFWRNLAVPLDSLVKERCDGLHLKNTTLFGHTGGYPLPSAAFADHLLGTGILLSMQQQGADRTYRAIGEKTPENVFLFPRLKRIFPRAKLIAIAREPRDVLASSWHIFHKPVAGENEDAAKRAFIHMSLPSMAEGARAMIRHAKEFPTDYAEVTYEALRQDPRFEIRRLFRFLGVESTDDVVESCVRKVDFFKQTSGRQPGHVDLGSFFRSGISGSWPETLTAEMSELILQHLGWVYPHFGWRI